jgi:predicted RNase H-like nuclease (RuvC/YqgF family)
MRALLITVVLVHFCYSTLAADDYESRMTDNAGMNKWERINHVEKKVLKLEDEVKSIEALKGEVERLRSEIVGMKKLLARLSEKGKEDHGPNADSL